MQQQIYTLPVLQLSMMIGQQACNCHSDSLSLESTLHAQLNRKHYHAYPSIEGVATCLSVISDLLRNSASTSCFNGVVNSGTSVGRLLSSKLQSCCAVQPVPGSARYRVMQMESKNREVAAAHHLLDPPKPPPQLLGGQVCPCGLCETHVTKHACCSQLASSWKYKILHECKAQA